MYDSILKNLNKIVNNIYPKTIPIVVEVIAPTNLLNRFKPDAVVMDSSIKKRIFNKQQNRIKVIMEETPSGISQEKKLKILLK